jgi:hypothetical protein
MSGFGSNNERTQRSRAVRPFAAQATLNLTANGGVDVHGNPLDLIGSLLLVADLNVSDNGSFQIDATA